MPRPRKCRRLTLTPRTRFYKPQGIPVRQLSVLTLKDEELEALALAVVNGMDHEKAAEHMHVSRPTFSRILAQAHQTVATALVTGAALKIGEHDRTRTALTPNQTQEGGENAQ